MGRRIGILAYSLALESGESRQAINLALGLKQAGHDPVIFSVAAAPEILSVCRSNELKVSHRQPALGHFDQLQLLLYGRRLAKKLGSLIDGEPPCDDYVVVQDAALPVVDLPITGSLTYLCCGDMLLLLLNDGFRKSRGFLPELLSTAFVHELSRHSQLVSRFDRVLANSHFTRSLMSFLYDCPVTGVVYPPVDLDLFSPSLSPPTGDHPYALAVLRGRGEPGYRAIAKLASQLRVKVVGRAKVPGAECLGPITDLELAKQYASAAFAISPSFREFFGYPIVESMACGTPAIAFAQGGALEIISHGADGWLAKDGRDLIALANDKMAHGYAESIRMQARATSEKFSLAASTSSLLRELGG